MKKEHLEADKKIKKESSVRKIILNSIRIILIIVSFLAFYEGRKLVFAISILALIITILPFLLKKTFGIKIPAEFEIIIIFFIYGLFLLGEVNSFYKEFTFLSLLFNFASAIALGFIGLTVMHTLYKGDKIHASPQIIALFSFCFAVAIGTVWEFFEFSIDSLFGFTLQRTTGDTMKGIIANMVGALIVSGAGYVYIKKGNSNLISRLVSKFIEKNSRIFGIKVNEDNNPQKIISLIEEGESNKLEFKSTLRTNLHTNQADKQVEHSILKTLAAYLNSDGGTLLIGVSDIGEICGIEKDNFESNDKLNLH
ncbi:MAG: ATP-binding protein, partial [Nanoarchaeota archaeon]